MRIALNIFLVAVILVLSCFRAPGCARAVVDLPTQQAIYKPGLEAIAVTFWERRGVSLPEPVELFVADSLGAEGEGVSGRGEEPGRRVWMSPPMFWSAFAYLRCLIYIHERGHNAGLPHGILPIMAPEVNPDKLRIPLCLRYAHVQGRMG